MSKDYDITDASISTCRWSFVICRWSFVVNHWPFALHQCRFDVWDRPWPYR
jgi:hypothetical protein